MIPSTCVRKVSSTPSRYLCRLMAQGISSGEVGNAGPSACSLAIQEPNLIGGYFNYKSCKLTGERQAIPSLFLVKLQKA